MNKLEFYKQVNKIFIEQYWKEDAVVILNKDIVDNYELNCNPKDVAIDLITRYNNKESDIVEYFYLE